MDEITLLVLQAVQARSDYDQALKELAFKATGFGMLKIEVIDQIETLAKDSHTSAADLISVANLAQGNCH
jgi:HSP90 family molecular chaperone